MEGLPRTLKRRADMSAPISNSSGSCLLAFRRSSVSSTLYFALLFRLVAIIIPNNALGNVVFQSMLYVIVFLVIVVQVSSY